MFSKCKGFAVLILCCIGLITDQSLANDVSDEPVLAQPNKCVALSQGRECFAQITLTWRTASEGDYCLVMATQESQVTGSRVLRCWDAASSGQLVYDMQSAENLVVSLQNKRDKQTIGRSVITVSWLYQSNSRKRRWRLF